MKCHKEQSGGERVCGWCVLGLRGKGRYCGGKNSKSTEVHWAFFMAKHAT